MFSHRHFGCAALGCTALFQFRFLSCPACPLFRPTLALLPNLQAGLSYRVFAPDPYSKIKEIIKKIVASTLIYLPSSLKDFSNPAIDPYLKRYVGGSTASAIRSALRS